MPVDRGAFGYWRDPVLLVGVAVYGVNRLAIKPFFHSYLHTYSPFFQGHLNDMLTVPVALPIFLFVYRRIGLRPDDQPPRWWEIALHVAVWSVFFEWFGPNYLRQGVGDPLDILSMAAGGVIAWFAWKWLTRRRPAST